MTEGHMAQSDRDVMFANESFLIGVLQAVPGASIAAGLSQSEPLIKFAGKIPLLVFLTAMVIALLAAVLAAYWKHDYKMWDLKTPLGKDLGDKTRRQERGGTSLGQMRWAMKISTFAIVVGFGVLIAAMWYLAF